jgi:hypothetical protein
MGSVFAGCDLIVAVARSSTVHAGAFSTITSQADLGYPVPYTPQTPGTSREVQGTEISGITVRRATSPSVNPTGAHISNPKGRKISHFWIGAGRRKK